MYDTCPYRDQPVYTRWRATVSAVSRGAVDPTTPSSPLMTPATPIVSAGSCFAQHIGANVRRRGYSYLVTEEPPAELDADEREERNYGVFSARYGNVYTTPQLLQLFERAYGTFTPAVDALPDQGRWIDPFRPFIEPDGFSTLEALRADRERHFAAVRSAFEGAGCFIFTLGLTEAWRNRDDGAYYPVCPGCGYGTFEPQRYEFLNLGVEESSAALDGFLERFSQVNPAAKVILTVSPVPLLATMSDRNVVEATVYSKSVLRVVAEAARRRWPFVEYFPAYEIVTATHANHAYFAGDGRTVTPRGVARVMDLFFATFAGMPAPPPPPLELAADVEVPEPVICDEEAALESSR